MKQRELVILAMSVMTRRVWLGSAAQSLVWIAVLDPEPPGTRRGKDWVQMRVTIKYIPFERRIVANMLRIYSGGRIIRVQVVACR